MAERHQIRVSVVDDRRLRRECLAETLAAEAGIEFITSESTGRAFLENDDAANSEIVLVAVGNDCSLALNVIWQIVARLPESRVIAVGIPADDEWIVQFLEAGASAYVLISGSYATLIETVEAVRENRPPCSASVLSLVLSRLRELSEMQGERQGVDLSLLTEREREIAKLVALGWSNKQIALELNIKLSTAKNHVHRILQKLDIERRSAIGRGPFPHRHLTKQNGRNGRRTNEGNHNVNRPT